MQLLRRHHNHRLSMGTGFLQADQKPRAAVRVCAEITRSLCWAPGWGTPGFKSCIVVN